MLSVGLSCSDLLLMLVLLLLMETISTFCFFSLNPFSRLPALEVGLLDTDKALFPPLELSIVFKSLDSTLSELPVDSLVMVTEPVEEEEVGVQLEDCVVNVAEDDIKDIEEEEEEELVLLLKPCLLESGCSLVLDEEDLTGDIVTLLLLLVSFFCGELAPKRCPSSSSTLSKADAVDIVAL